MTGSWKLIPCEIWRLTKGKRPEQFAALLFGEVEIGQNIGLAVVEETRDMIMVRDA